MRLEQRADVFLSRRKRQVPYVQLLAQTRSLAALESIYLQSAALIRISSGPSDFEARRYRQLPPRASIGLDPQVRTERQT